MNFNFATELLWNILSILSKNKTYFKPRKAIPTATEKVAPASLKAASKKAGLSTLEKGSPAITSKDNSALK